MTDTASELVAYLRYAERVDAGLPRDLDAERRAQAALSEYLRRQPKRKLVRR